MPGHGGGTLADPAGTLGIGAGDEVGLIGAPQWFEDVLRGLPEVAGVGTGLAGDARYDVVVAFVTQRAELADELPRLQAVMAPACGLWIAWPRRACWPPSDLTGDAVRAVALAAGLAGGIACDFDDTWSGLRFVSGRQGRLRAG